MKVEITFEGFERHVSWVLASQLETLKELLEGYSVLWKDARNKEKVAKMIDDYAEKINLLKRSLKNEI